MVNAVGVAIRDEYNHCKNNYNRMPANTKGWTWVKAAGAGVAVGVGILIIAAVASRGSRLGLGFGLGITGGALASFGTAWYITHNYTWVNAGADHGRNAVEQGSNAAQRAFNWGKRQIDKLS